MLWAIQGSTDGRPAPAAAQCLAVQACRVYAGPGARAARADDGSLLVFEGQLHNRAELLRQLSSPGAPPPDDTSLLLLAFQRWGDRFPERLLGEFAIVVWDAARHSLLCIRDQLGRLPLFWTRDAGRLLVASTPQGLLRGFGLTPRCDLDFLAWAAVPGALYQENTRTYFAGVKTIPAASVLRLGSGQESLSCYWQPDPEARLGIPDREIPEALRELLFDAVAVRLPVQGPVVSLLSGGLDSSSLVAIAAQLLKGQNRELLALSAVTPPDQANPHRDEREFISAFAGWDNVRLQDITAPGRGPFDNLDRLRELPTPLSTSRHYLYSAFDRVTQEAGADRLMDGICGEMGPSGYARGYPQELLLGLRWRQLLHLMQGFAARERQSLPAVLRGQLLKPMLPAFLLAWLGRGRTDIAHALAGSYHRADFLASRVGDPVRAAHRNEAALQRQWNHRQHAAESIRLLQRVGCQGDGRLEAERQGIHHALPYFDRRVLSFCLAAPGHWKMRDGYKRYLIRAALDGVLPPEIQWRTSKEPFSPDFQLRYNRQRPEVAARLAAIAAGDPVREVVDIDRLCLLAAHDMQTNRSSTAQDFMAMHQVPGGVYLIAFLRQFAEFQVPDAPL